MQKVALSIIVGDGQDSDQWDNLLRSVENVVTKIFVSYNGKKKNFPYTQTGNMVVENFEWVDDFSKARNHAFSMIPKGAFDWILWMDSDDTLVNTENFEEMLERGTSAGLHQIFLPYIYASDEDGTPRVTQWRERLLRTNVPWRWYYKIHEICHTQPGNKSANYDDVLIVHHREIDPFSHEETRKRNRRILAAGLEESPDEPRYIFYQANEMFAEAFFLFERRDPNCVVFFKQAIELYKQFGMTNPGSDDAYISNYRIGDSLRMMEQWPKAVDVAMQCIKIRPTWPEGWMLASHAMLGMSEYAACEEFVTCALAVMKTPITNQVAEPITLHYTPYALRALARTEQQNWDGAIEDYKVALDYWENEKLREHYERTLELKEGVTKKGASDTRSKMKGKKPTRSIAFMTRPLPEAWNAETLKAGSGGAEWCVHEIARRFADDGFRTAIFGTPGTERGVDSEGIEWWDSADYDPQEEFSYVTSVRAPEVFDTPLKARKGKVLWLHDINMGGKEIMSSPWGNRFDHPDHIICLTEFHSRREQRIYNVNSDKITVIGNGINLEDYPEWTRERKKGKFIYASSPDRGIDTLLQMWPEIKEAIPEANLDVYYGWNMLDKIVAMSGGQSPLAQYKERVVAIYDSVKHLDVEWHNRVSRKILQEVETECHMWLYPTHFLETYCITAVEMAMNGAIGMVNPVGALAETAPFAIQVQGMPNHPDYRKRYVEEMARVYNLPEENQEFLRLTARDWAAQQTWDSRYDKWREMLGVTAKKKVMVP